MCINTYCCENRQIFFGAVNENGSNDSPAGNEANFLTLSQSFKLTVDIYKFRKYTSRQ